MNLRRLTANLTDSWTELLNSARFMLIVSYILMGWSSIMLVGYILPELYKIPAIGLDGGENISTTTKRDPNGNVIETVVTKTPESDKTLWDFINILIVPLILLGIGNQLQSQQQKRTSDEAKEEALQTYIDRISELLVDKNLLAITRAGESATAEQRELLDAAVDVIRARTLTILRRFEKDRDLKTSVIQFLIESEILRKTNLKLNTAQLDRVNLVNIQIQGVHLEEVSLNKSLLAGADLSNSNLSRSSLRKSYMYKTNLKDADLILSNLEKTRCYEANLEGAKLGGANLKDASLILANLTNANLYKANLQWADLRGARLEFTIFEEADMTGAMLYDAVIFGANFQKVKGITKEQISEAKLCLVSLPDGIDLDPNRDCDEIYKIYKEKGWTVSNEFWTLLEQSLDPTLPDDPQTPVKDPSTTPTNFDPS